MPKFLIILRITTDDPDDDPRHWPYDEMLAPPEGEKETRYIEYVAGAKEDTNA